MSEPRPCLRRAASTPRSAGSARCWSADPATEKQAEANKIVAESISKDPNVLASRCYPGSSDSVVVPSAK